MKSDQTHVAFPETDRASTGAREMRPLHDLSSYLREYARERPEVVALTCFTAGFILGWRLKPW